MTLGTINTTSAKISVIIPAYNRESTIKACLESVIYQSQPPAEIIVVDDNSNDNTANIASSYPQVSVIRLEKRNGAQHARNIGIKAATSQWIAFNDSDDIWLTDKLEIQTSYINTYGSNIYHSNCIINQDGFYRNWKYDIGRIQGESYKQILQGYSPLFPTMLVEKTAFDRIGYLDEKCPSYQEWETAIRLSKHYNFIYINKPTFIYSFKQKDSISENKALSTAGYEYITQKYKQQIIENLGIEDLKARYLHMLHEYISINDKKILLNTKHL